MDRTAYDHQAEAFLTELLAEQFDVGAGLKPSLELAPIYSRHAGLFEESIVRTLLAERDTVAGRYRAGFAVSGYLEDQNKELVEEIENAELAACVSWDGSEIPFRQVPVVLTNEGDITRRAELARRYHAGQAEINPKRVWRWNRTHKLVRDLGFDDYVSAFDELRGLSLRRLAQQVVWVLEVTEQVFARGLAERLEAHGIPREAAGIWDVASILRAREHDSLFPAEGMAPALRRTLAGLGIDLDAQANVRLDAEPRPLKSPRAFCVDVRAPEDVRLVINPAGGVDDYGSLFHEAGHAEHFAHVAPDLDLVFRRMGDSSVTETYAFLLEHLLMSPAWLEGVLGIKPAHYGGALEALRFRLLWFVRRYSAKLNYEMELHSGLVDAKASAYAHWLQRGCSVQIPQQRFLADVDDGFYVAQYLRAWIFEAQLRRYLENQFGAEWFARPAAGEFLKGLWRSGQRLPVDEMALQIGAAGLELAPLVQQLTLG